MNTIAIPAWNTNGVLPPVDPHLPTSPVRSPYPVSLKDLVMRFSTSSERRSVIKSFLGYRKELHRIGLSEGFQWIDGSFLEDVETIEQRAPRDIDVVSFFNTPASLNISDDDAYLFDHDILKKRINIDAYYVELDQITPRMLTHWSAYWYGLWSHRRTQVWKGFLQIELTPVEDADALAWLTQFERTEGEP